MDSPGVIFDEESEDGKGNRKASVLLRNVVRVEDVEDPVGVGELLNCSLSHSLVQYSQPEWQWYYLLFWRRFLVDEILARTEKEKIQRIYNLPEFGSGLEFLTMLALSTGKLLKVCLRSLLSPLPQQHPPPTPPTSALYRPSIIKTQT